VIVAWTKPRLLEATVVAGALLAPATAVKRLGR
jgi:hypothetical protein